MKKKLLLSMAAAMVLSSSMTVCATPQYMDDGAVFDPEWYLEQNPDVASAWSQGTSADAVYMHYTMYGAGEGRKPYNAAALDTAGILPYLGMNAADTPGQNTTAPEPASTKNIPVGTSFTYEDTYSEPTTANSAVLSDWDLLGHGNGFSRTYRYTFPDGSWLEFTCRDTDSNVNGHAYMSETTDTYGITYQEYRPGANELVMNTMAAYMAQNPDSNFTSMLQQNGNLFVVVSANGLYDDTYDYDWNGGIIDCEPEDCIYMFVNTFDMEEDPEYVIDSCMSMFEYVGENYTVREN